MDKKALGMFITAYWRATMSIGDVEGVNPGMEFPDRKTLAAAGVHRATQAGITGVADVGAESIVLSGGYVDDVDNGSEIIYTGHGGRDANSGRQIADQTFTRQNQALVTSCLNGLPVRVVRGGRHASRHSPTAGYRYDGLYFVDSYWQERGKDGFSVCRFRLVQGGRPETVSYSPSGGPAAGPAPRVSTQLFRIVRDSLLGKRIKDLYEYKCQVCGEVLDCVGGFYAEAAHIRPVGRPHDGPDEVENLLCLCPNHHVLFDRGGFSIKADFSLIGLEGRLQLHADHLIRQEHLSYHRALWKR